MSAVALHLYEKLNEAPDDKARSKAIVEAFSELEERYPNLKKIATQRNLSETELRLQKEIEMTRLEIKTVEANLQKEIEKVRIEIKQVEVNFSKAVHQQTLWIIGSVGTIVMSVRLLEWFLAHLAK